MNVNSLGDLAQGYSLRSRNAELKTDIQRLSLELSTGQTSDVRGALAGNYSFLTDVDRKLSLMESYGIATSEASSFASQTQAQLQNFNDLSVRVSSTLISVGTSISGAPSDEISREAKNVLDEMVSALNGTFAGRALFSGNATDRPAVVDSEVLLDNLRAAITGVSTPTDMITAAEAWFDDPAGFAATSYLGSSENLSPFNLSPDDTVQLDILATDPVFRTNLRAAAVAALADDPAFALSSSNQQQVFKLAGQAALVGRDGITGLQARIGFSESRIENIEVRNTAESTSLTIARNTLLEADPFTTATQLEEVQFQLQSLYSVTVRMSQLSLINYL